MTSLISVPKQPWLAARMRGALAVAALATIGACAQAPVSTTGTPSASSTGAPSPDPRIGLKTGLWDAGEAIWNLRLVSASRPPEQFVGGINSDLAFTGNYVIQGSFRGYQV